LRRNNGRREKRNGATLFASRQAKFPGISGDDPNLTAAVPYPMRKPVGIGYPASFGLGATGRRRCGDAMEGWS
jgi:hypothetical protein